MAKKSTPAIPPRPTEGGSYELVNNEWVCIRRTAQPGEALPEPEPVVCPAPQACQNEPEPSPVPDPE